MVSIIEGDSISQVWIRLLDEIINNGTPHVHDERHNGTTELLNAVCVIHDPFNVKHHDFFSFTKALEQLKYIPLPNGFFWGKDELEIYSKQFLNPENENGFIYTYGNRLRKFHGIDQINAVIDRLNECRNSRRATCTTWYPRDDCVSGEVPCLIMVDFKIRDGVLYMSVVYRSQDAYGAFFSNLCGLANLAAFVAHGTDCVVGDIVLHAVSSHIYDLDLEFAHNVVRKNLNLLY